MSHLPTVRVGQTCGTVPIRTAAHAIGPLTRLWLCHYYVIDVTEQCYSITFARRCRRCKGFSTVILLPPSAQPSRRPSASTSTHTNRSSRYTAARVCACVRARLCVSACACACVHACVRVRACVRACARVRERVCVRARVRALIDVAIRVVDWATAAAVEAPLVALQHGRELRGLADQARDARVFARLLPHLLTHRR